MTSGIFISYRRLDSQGSAGRLADKLKADFTQSQIFRDIETIEPGADFVQSIERALASCVVLLAIIGPRWLNIEDKNGKRRLDDEHDYTRIEIAVALERNVRVIPVLVDGATMPDAADLPDNLKALARRQASELSDKRWDFDVQQLCATLEKLPGITKAKPIQPATFWTNKKLIWTGVFAVLLAGAVINAVQEQHPQQGPLNHYQDDQSVDTPSVVAPPAVQEKPAPQNLARQADIEVTPPRKTTNSYPDVSGNWSDVDGIGYRITQQGPSIYIAIVPNRYGRQAEGRGTLVGRMLTLDYRYYDPNIGYTVGKAQVEVADDGSTMHGTYVETASGVSVPVFLKR